MKREMIAKEILKIAKDILSSSDINSFPFKGKCKEIKIGHDDAVWIEGMKWDSEKISMSKQIVNNGEKYSFKDVYTIYVFGISGDYKNVRVWIQSESSNPFGGNKKTDQFLRSIESAISNSSWSIESFIDPESIYEAEEELSDDVKEEIENYYIDCVEKCKQIAEKLAYNL